MEQESVIKNLRKVLKNIDSGFLTQLIENVKYRAARSNILETKRVPCEEAVRIQVDKYIILEWLSTYYHSSKGQ